jgi:hypothetical protein
MANKFYSTGKAVSTTEATVYEVPAATYAVVLGLSAASKATTDLTLQVKVRRGSDAWNLVSPTTVLPTSGTVVIVGGDQKVNLIPGDKIVCTSSIANGFDAFISILELS